jgi:tRNA nucleotidyltransferase (CCA-adding enzyme)
MHFYPAGEAICCALLDLPQDNVEWIITGATVKDIVAAGFQRQPSDEYGFIHPESGDIYRMARRQFVDKLSDELCFEASADVRVEDELASRPLTILAIAKDGSDIIDPFGGHEDLDNGVLRHVTPHFAREPVNLLIVAVWAARLSVWGFSVAHATHALMKKMVTSGSVEQLEQHQISDAVLQAIASPRPSAFFRVLHRCGALKSISKELDALYAEQTRGDKHHSTKEAMPGAMQVLDRVAAENDNILSVLKQFHQALGGKAEQVFIAFGLDMLYRDVRR